MIIDFFLLFTRDYILIPILILLYLTSYKGEATRLLFIMLFSMVLNAYLKSYFAIPLPESVNPDAYAFPSGHMQLAFAFWGWMMVEFRTKVYRFFCIGVLLGVGGSLVQKGYHDWFDVLGAVGFGLISLLIYYWIVKKQFSDSKNLPMIGGVLTIFAFLLIMMNEKTSKIDYLVMGAMIGFTFGVYLSQKTKLWAGNFAIQYILINCVVAFIGVGILYWFFSLNIFPISNNLSIFLHYFLIAIWTSYLTERLTIKR